MTGPAPRTAVVTALPKEHAAVSRLLVGSQPVTLDGDSTLYRYGTIPGATGHHEVVLACLTKYGNNTGSITATNLHRSFPSVRDIILVGICAGVPGRASRRRTYTSGTSSSRRATAWSSSTWG
ncbi:hypothetical protein GCM10029964_109890 [Kibdelosporangium lantanae]